MDAIARSIDFIAWGNFADVRVLALWLLSLALVGGVAYIAWQTGGLILGRTALASDAERLVLHVGVGLSAWSFVLFVMALVGLYRPWAVATGAVAVVAVAFARGRWRALGEPLRMTGRVIRRDWWLWLLFLSASMASLLPPYRWDEISYHLAYAHQWVESGRLTLDPFMRYPLYANAWLLFEGIGLMAGSETLVHLLSWLSGVLGALVVGVFLARLGVARSLQIIATLAYFLTPLVQRYLNVGLIDVPLAAFLAIAVLALHIVWAAPDSNERLAVGAGMVAGLFVGMKGAGLLYIPMFAALALWRLPRRRVLLHYLAAFALIGSPWFLRNLVIAGDPLPPLGSRFLGREALYWSTEDIAAQERDVREGLEWTPRALLSLPWRLVTARGDGVLRDWPLLGYVLVFPLSLGLFLRPWRVLAFEPLVAAWYSAAVWVATSYHVRYAMFVVLSIIVAALVLHAAQRQLGARARRWAIAASAFLLIGPTFNAGRYLKHTFSQRIPIGDAARWRYVTRRLPEAAALDSLAVHAPAPARVYTVGFTHLKYFFQKQGYHLLGDVFHQGRYGDFARALEGDSADRFIWSLPADYVAIDRKYAARTLLVDADDLVPTLSALRSLELMHVDSMTAVLRVVQPARGVGAARWAP